MSKKNKFGFAPVEAEAPAPRNRAVGPMGAAIRDTAESLSQSTEAKVEQRRQNAEDAKAFRSAQDAGLMLQRVPLDEVHSDDLPRDRLDLEAVAVADEMEELKASIRARGQKEPVELYRGGDGRLQIKKGWRRYTALSQLFAETRDEAFSTVLARVADGEDRMAGYIDMVEENVVREDLTFAEMAQVAITAAQDPGVDGADPLAMVGTLYASLHKMKKSYIRGFVTLLAAVGDDLRWPKSVPRNAGIEAARALKAGGDAGDLRMRLRAAATADAQNAVLVSFAQGQGGVAAKPAKAPRQKFEFHVGRSKVTARQGECRILSDLDFAAVPRPQLERAIRAFEAALEEGGNPRVTPL
ncbi:ParB N-terminal domain-containing protein [Sulfitobacter albidus]|uniref:ParB N-terminal domain-containing protein n=1 Tax=Sulfitobacter albidus TaxID=2829501 RepID=A0A975JH98_9RHOB|nr:ParB N-terminal domain-containing protein [Sulfitobacter albidus]QUJ78176.1 ParB N-terminal domain-containing protein [Sulfitobacter albidus]